LPNFDDKSTTFNGVYNIVVNIYYSDYSVNIRIIEGDG